MSRLWSLLLGVAVFLLIAGFCTRWHRPLVAQTVVDAAQGQLEAAGISGIDVSHLERRDVVLRGSVTDQATRDLVEKTVLAHPLVARVSNRIDAPESNPTISSLAGRELLAEESFESTLGAFRDGAECRARLGEHLSSSRLRFAAGSDQVAPTDVAFLERTSELMAACPGAEIRLSYRVGEGESEDLNLSRASSVIAALEGDHLERRIEVVPNPSPGTNGQVEMTLVEE